MKKKKKRYGLGNGRNRDNEEAGTDEKHFNVDFLGKTEQNLYQFHSRQMVKLLLLDPFSCCQFIQRE